MRRQSTSTDILHCQRKTKMHLHSHRCSHTNIIFSVISFLIIQPREFLPQFLDREDSSVQKFYLQCAAQHSLSARPKLSNMRQPCCSSKTHTFTTVLFLKMVKHLFRESTNPTQFSKRHQTCTSERESRRGATPVLEFKQMWKDWVSALISEQGGWRRGCGDDGWVRGGGHSGEHGDVIL